MSNIAYTINYGIVHVNIECKDPDINEWYYIEQLHSSFVSIHDIEDNFYSFSCCLIFTLKTL